jgi:hypothetical protein
MTGRSEGIEDGLSAHVATGVGAWAAGAAGFMPALADRATRAALKHQIETFQAGCEARALLYGAGANLICNEAVDKLQADAVQ